MKLYHGTTEAVALKALKTGLLPRKKIRKQNWEHTVPSNPNCVYLTETYAGYFAFNACRNGENWAIIEVDISKLRRILLNPDEDVLEQAARMDPNAPKELKGLGMLKRTLWFRERIQDYQQLWMDSLEAMGTCAYYGTIRPSAFTKVAIYKPRSNPEMTVNASDPTITLINFKIMAEKYRTITRWLMGEHITADEWIKSAFFGHPDYEKKKEMFGKWLQEREVEIIYEKR